MWLYRVMITKQLTAVPFKDQMADHLKTTKTNLKIQLLLHKLNET